MSARNRGVYLNRLAQGMKLEADYRAIHIGLSACQQPMWKTPVFPRIQRRWCPYNTYLYPGCHQDRLLILG